MNRFSAWAAATVLAALAPLAAAQGTGDWVAVKDPKELRDLFMNTTFRGKGPTGDAFTAYNRSDGMRLVIIPQTELTMTWRVDGERVCVQVRSRSAPERCQTYQKSAVRKGEYRSMREPDGAVATFKVEQGIKGARQF